MNYTTMSLDAIKYLCNCVNKLANVSEGIDDLNLRTDGTFSSVRIDALLNTLKTDCNEYTDRLVANLSRLELKIANAESEITQPNIMYLYKPSGATSYEQYVVIEGIKVLLGTCDIDMNNYYTISQANAKFTLQTDFDALKTKVDGKANATDLTTHTDDTDIHVTSAERTKWNEVDNKVDKTDIVSVLDSTVTNKQLVDGKTLVDKFNSIEDSLSLRYNFDNRKSKSIVDRKLAIKAVINTLKKDDAIDSSVDYYENNLVFLIRYNGGYYYTYIMTSYMTKVFIQEYSPYATDMNFWLEDEMGELYIRGTIPITQNIIRIVNPFTTNKDKYKLYDGQYTIDENTKTCTLTVSIDCLSPASVSIDVGSLNTLNLKTPSSPRTFDLKAEDDSTSIMRFYLGSTSCQVWLGTAGKRYTGTVTYTAK